MPDDNPNNGIDDASNHDVDVPDDTSTIPAAISGIENNPQDRRPIGQIIEAMGATMHFGNPLADKFTGEHITSLISLQNEDLRLEYEDRKQSRLILTGLLIFIVVMAIGFGVFLVINQKDVLLSDLITKISIGSGGFGIGVAAGWGGREYFTRRG